MLDINKYHKSRQRMAEMLHSRLHEHDESDARFNYLAEDDDNLIEALSYLKSYEMSLNQAVDALDELVTCEKLATADSVCGKRMDLAVQNAQKIVFKLKKDKLCTTI